MMLADMVIEKATRAAAASTAGQRADRRLAKVEKILAGSFLRARTDALAAIGEAELIEFITVAARSIGKAEGLPKPSWYEGGVSAMSLLGRPYTVVWVELAAFAAAFKDHGEHNRRPSATLIDAIGERVSAGVMLTPPIVANLGRSWGFLEGRNRFLYALSAEADTMPIAVPNDDHEAFLSVFGEAPTPITAAGGVHPNLPAGRSLNLVEAIDRAAFTLASRFFSSVTAAANALGEDEAARISATLAARGRTTKAEADAPVIDFSTPNLSAMTELNLAALNLIRQMTDEQLEVITQVLRDGIERGINPVQMAREIRASVGLTTTQETYVQNYRRALMNAHTSRQAAANAIERALHDGRMTRPIQTAARTGEALTQRQIEDMTARYRERFISYRAKVIARTQALRAVHMGETAAWEAAIASGDIVAAEVTQTWHTARDERVRFAHRTLEGQQRGWGKPFETWSGAQLRFPGDPLASPALVINCRCVLTRQISEQPIAATV